MIGYVECYLIGPRIHYFSLCCLDSYLQEPFKERHKAVLHLTSLWQHCQLYCNRSHLVSAPTRRLCPPCKRTHNTRIAAPTNKAARSRWTMTKLDPVYPCSTNRELNSGRNERIIHIHRQTVYVCPSLVSLIEIRSFVLWLTKAVCSLSGWNRYS